MAPEQAPIDATPNEASSDDTADTDWKKQAEELKAQLDKTSASVETLKQDSDRNIRRLQSSYTQQLNSMSESTSAERDRLENQYHEQKMSGMEESDALRYDNARLAEKLEIEAENTARIRQQASDATAAASYVQQFANLGVPAKALNTRGSLQDLADSGWGALAEIRAQERSNMTASTEQLATIQSQLDELKAAAPETDPNRLAESKGDLSPPNVASHTPGEASNSKGMFEVAKSLEGFFGYVPTEEDIYRAVETGRLSPTVLPGLDTLQEN